MRFREIDLSEAKWSQMGGNWTKKGTVFSHSPEGVKQKSFNFYLSDHELQDGAVEGSVRTLEGSRANCGGRLVFRYGPSGCYYAGVGGYGREFTIIKYMRGERGQISRGLAKYGQVTDPVPDESYRLRVEFVGEHITLKKEGVTVLECRDSWLHGGHIGLQTFGRARVEFSNMRAYEVPPVGHLIDVLERFPDTLKRDYAYHKRELENEADVQRMLWTILRSHFVDLVDEEYLGRFGLKHYKDDFGIPSLRTIVEVKVVKPKTDVKRLQEELMVDAVGYFSSQNIYRHLVVFIYNKANKLIDTVMVQALESLEPIAAVVVVPGATYS